MIKLSAIQKLDKALFVINHCNKPPRVNDGDIIKEINNGLDNPMDAKELFEILHKLREDKVCFCDVTSEAVWYFSTFEGQLLEQSGGYEAKFLAQSAAYERDIAEIERIKSVDNQTLKNQEHLNTLTNRLNLATWVAGIATTLYLLWAMYSFYHPLHC